MKDNLWVLVSKVEEFLFGLKSRISATGDREEGATAVEYALIIALVALAIIGVFTGLGQAIISRVQSVITGIGG